VALTAWAIVFLAMTRHVWRSVLIPGRAR
jgi:hypothetical protein